MGLEPTVGEQQLLADTFRRRAQRLAPRERLAATAICALLALATGLLWLLDPPHQFPLLPALICMLALVVAACVRFETPLGFTVPIQLAFVPLLFVVPLALVPLVVSLALVLQRLPAVLQRKTRADRLLNTVANAAFSLGPVAVFAAAGVSPLKAGPLLLLAALLSQFAVDFLSTIARDAIERSPGIARQFRDAWIYGIDAALAFLGWVIAEQMHRTPVAGLATLPLLAILATFARERHRRLEGLLELNHAYRGTALVLGDVVEADDGYTGEHCKSVVALSTEVGEHLGLDAERLRNLEFGALLHDIGKIAIPKEIINKPAKLNPQEWTIIKTHTIEGQRMLDRVGGFMHEVGKIVRSHHERWDGDGYPDGLAGEAIPLESRIIFCCDTWNAMRTNRSYRSALSYEVALEEMRSAAGSQLDPHMVEALIDVVAAERIEHDAQPELVPDGVAVSRMVVTSTARSSGRHPTVAG